MAEIRESELLFEDTKKLAFDAREFFYNFLNCSKDDDELFLLGSFYKKEDLRKYESTFEKAKNAENVAVLKSILKEDTIPKGLLGKQKLWDELQKNVVALHRL